MADGEPRPAVSWRRFHAQEQTLQTRDERRRVQSLVEQALALPAGERPAFLDRACGGEPDVRSAVEAALSEEDPVATAGDETEAVLRPRRAGHPPADGETERGGDGGREGGSQTRVGPYRVVGLLGRGGMGEVFEAYDERLDRTVALKRVHLKGALDADVRRQRFRREARSAARLSHPGIVAVYDLLEDRDEDWLVMERVEGTRLSDLLARGPLPEGRALRLGREVADALAAAHARGIVHRDLKPTNVILSDDDRPRLLDFGLAKPLAGTAEAAVDATLTREGVMVGTARSMSPEQVRGGDVGPPSDLFSLGVLLYEALTGVSPFDHANPMVAAGRVEAWEPPPVREVAPEVSAESSDLVGRLLAKRPEDRPGSAAAVVAEIDRILEEVVEPHRASLSALLRRTLGRSRRGRWIAVALLAVAAMAVLLVLAVPEPAPLRVVVLEPERVGEGDGGAPGTETPEEEGRGELISAAVFSAVQQGLVVLEGIEAVTPRSLEETLSGPGAALRELAADEALHSRLDCRGTVCQLTLSRVAAGDDGGAGPILWTERLEVPVDDYRLLARAVSAHLDAGYPEHSSRGGTTFADLPPGAYERYLRLSQRLWDASSAGDPELLADAAALRREAPELVEAYLLEAAAARQSHHFSRQPEQLERARDLLDDAADLAPRDLRVARQRFDLALEAGELDGARAILDHLQEVAPSDADVLERRATLAAREGHREEALAWMRRAAEVRPSFGKLYNLALMEYQQGELEAARGRLERLLERAPESVRARALLAQFELLDGSVERAAELYRQLAERTGGVMETANLGLAQLLLGRHEEAVDSYREAYGAQPENLFLALNLADALLLSGREGEAEELYLRIVEGIPPEAEGWQNRTVRAQALAHLGQEREAVEAVQQALQLAPDNPQVAYEAALVYALLGYGAPAQVNAERALRAGVDERWFAFPWFDPLRDRLDAWEESASQP